MIWPIVLTLMAVSRALGQLSPTGLDVEKVACKDIEPARNFTLVLGLLAVPALYMVPLASLPNVRVYAATFLGRYAKDQAEVDRMCMNILFAGTVTIQMGYEHQTYINLAIPTQVNRGLGIFDFSQQVTHSPYVNTLYQATSIETIPLSDGKDWAMFVRCINNDFMDWKVASKRPLTPGEKTSVLDVAHQLGFDTTKYYDRDNTASGFKCRHPPTVPEAAVQTLVNFRIFSHDSPLLRTLAQPLWVMGKSYNNVVSLLNSLIVGPVLNLANNLIGNCTTRPGILGQLPLGCKLLGGNSPLSRRV